MRCGSPAGKGVHGLFIKNSWISRTKYGSEAIWREFGVIFGGKAMKAAVVKSFERPPCYADFREPKAGAGEMPVKLRAAALSNLVKGQASGKHYSSGSELPLVPGYDGVGTLPDGRRVYFFGPPTPWGSMAEWSLAVTGRMILLPDSVDDVTAAALGNPGLASWGSLLGRARLQPGESVLVNGATGIAGQQAIQVAKVLGAKRVIATGRDQAALEQLRELGADETIWLQQPADALTTAFRAAMQNVDVVLDYLWGASAELLLAAAKGHGGTEGERRIRYVQIGSISGETIRLEGGLLRSSGVELMGSGLGSLSAAAIVESLTRMYEVAASTGLKIETEEVPLSEVETAWGRAEGGRRMVFTM
jgi:NADPH:quinone reductase-like Zn-dependent oxidoreductase